MKCTLEGIYEKNYAALELGISVLLLLIVKGKEQDRRKALRNWNGEYLPCQEQREARPETEAMFLQHVVSVDWWRDLAKQYI